MEPYRVLFSDQKKTSEPAVDMFGMLGRVMWMPLTALAYGLTKMAESMRDLQEMGVKTMAAPAFRNVANAAPPPPQGAEVAAAGRVVQETSNDVAVAQVMQKERKKMPDTDLADEQLKLVRYKILFVMRDYECAFREQEELIHDNLTDSAYSGWKIAEFIQHLPSIEDRDLPANWKKYKCDKGVKVHPKAEDKKYLRVFYEVLDRYPREELRYHEETLKELGGIKHELSRISTKIAPDL